MLSMRFRVWFGMLLPFLLAAPLHAAEAPALGELSLISIEEGSPQRIDSLTKGALLLSFFEPECPWCARQIRDLDAAQTQCAKPLPFVLVGVHGDRMALRMMLRRVKAEHLPAYVASPALLDALNGIPATPHTVILDTQSRPLARMRGYIPLEKLCEMAELLAVPTK